MWLAGLDRRDEELLAVAYWLDELCQTTLEKTGKELAPEHAAVLALRLAVGVEAQDVPLAA